VSARDDYPELARQARHSVTPSGYVLKVGGECSKVLAEVDSLRADVAKLLAMCATAGAVWPTSDVDDTLCCEGGAA